MKDEESISKLIGLGDPMSDPISEEQERRLRSLIDRVRETTHLVEETEDGLALFAVCRPRTHWWVRDYDDGDQS